MFEDTYTDVREETQIGTKAVTIKVIGIGGAGNNTINRLVDADVKVGEYIAVNTDIQDLFLCKADKKIQIGKLSTKGLGAGSYPDIGEKAAMEDLDEIAEECKDTELLFITCGMGGGTGTGAAPVIAKKAKELGCLVVAVVTKPFAYEGKKRNENALRGIETIKKFVDTLIIIPNDTVSGTLKGDASVLSAYGAADENLKVSIIGISDLLIKHGLINLDFNDLKTIMANKGIAHIGFGKARGENRVLEALRQAVNSPMLNTTVKGASNVLLNISGDKSLNYQEVNYISTAVNELISDDSNVILGTCIDDEFKDYLCITIVATGFVDDLIDAVPPKKQISIEEIKNDADRFEKEQEDIVMPPVQPVKPKQPEMPSSREQPAISKNNGKKPPFLDRMFGKK